MPDSALPVARELGVATFRITVPWEPGARTLPPDVVAQLDAMVSAEPPNGSS